MDSRLSFAPIAWEYDIVASRVRRSDGVEVPLCYLETQSDLPDFNGFLTGLAPESFEVVRKAFKAVLSGLSPYHISYRLVLPGGETCEVTDRAAVFYDGEGRPLRMAGVLCRKETEGPIASASGGTEPGQDESEERYRYLVEVTPHLLFVADAQGNNEFWNQHFYDYTGMTPQENTGLNWTHIIHPEDVETTVERWATAVGTGNPYEMEYRFRRASDGTYRWFLGRALPQRDAHGRIIRWYGVCIDIEEQKRAESEAEDLNRRLSEKLIEFKTLLDTVPIGIALAHDAQCHRITGNPAFYRTLGVQDGENLSLSTAPTDRPPGVGVISQGKPMPPEDQPMQRAARGEEVSETELDITLGDGRKVTFLGSASPLFDDRGAPRGSIGAFVDITERKRAEEERARHLTEIETLNERLRRAMQETHHRVKNNLQVISALVDMQTQAGTEAIPREEMRRIGLHVGNLAAIHDLLTQRAKDTGEATHISARDVLLRLVEMSRAANPRTLFLAELEEITVPVKHSGALAMLANELVSNAVKHGRSRVSLHLSKAGEAYTLEVGDDGPGFPDGFNPLVAANTGLELVESIARWDFQGETVYTVAPDGGGLVRVTFPETLILD